MKTYTVKITETNAARIEVEAENEGDAEEKAREMYDKGEIMMDEYWHDNGYVDFLVDHSEPTKIYIKD